MILLHSGLILREKPNGKARDGDALPFGLSVPKSISAISLLSGHYSPWPETHPEYVSQPGAGGKAWPQHLLPKLLTNHLIKRLVTDHFLKKTWRTSSPLAMSQHPLIITITNAHACEEATPYVHIWPLKIKEIRKKIWKTWLASELLH